jgi:alkylation response protein AidB-like acyl-CoA dehydrogenase
VAYACASTAAVMSVHNSIVCESILRYGSEDQKKRHLTKLATGKIIGAFALTEPNAGSDPSRQTTRAVFDGDSYLLNGSKKTKWDCAHPTPSILFLKIAAFRLKNDWETKATDS